MSATLLHMSINAQQGATYTVYFICKLLYMLRVVSPPITRSINNCIYSIWYCSTFVVTGRYGGGFETDLCVLHAAHTNQSQLLHHTDR